MRIHLNKSIIICLLLSPFGFVFSQSRDLELHISKIDSFISQKMIENQVPGVSYVIVRDDSIVHQKAFGYADDLGRKMSISTPVALPAIANSFTAIAILQLAEKGKLDLDDNVVRHLPWFTLKDKEASSQITIRHLLLQQSGINHLDGETFFKKADTSKQALRTLVKEFDTFSMDFDPGSKSVYSNANSGILGLLIETISGQSFEEYIHQNILDTLGMTDSFVNNFNPKSKNRASPHRYWFGQNTSYIPRPDRRNITGTAIFISARDAAKYMNALLQKDIRLLNKDSYAMIFDSKLEAYREGSAFGWFRDMKNTTQFSSYGWGEGHSASILLFTEQKVGIAVFANSVSGFALGNVWDIVVTPGKMIQGISANTAIPTFNYLMFAAVILIIILFTFFIFRLLRKYFLNKPIRVPSKTNRIISLVFCLSLAWFFIIGLPNLVSEVPIEAVFLYTPDVGWTLLLAAISALTWALLRILIPYLTKRNYK